MVLLRGIPSARNDGSKFRGSSSLPGQAPRLPSAEPSSHYPYGYRLPSFIATLLTRRRQVAIRPRLWRQMAMVCNRCVPRSRRTPHENHRAHIAAAFVRPRRHVLPNLTEASSRSPVVTGMDNGKRSDRWRITPRKSATYETKPSNFESSRRPLTPSGRKNCVPWPSSSKSAPRNWRCADRSGCETPPSRQMAEERAGLDGTWRAPAKAPPAAVVAADLAPAIGVVRGAPP